MNEYVLVKMDVNYADEFDACGFSVGIFKHIGDVIDRCLNADGL